MQTNLRVLNHEWHGPLLVFYRSRLSACSQPRVVVYRPARARSDHASPGWRPFTAFNPGAMLPDYRRQLPRMLPAQVLNPRRRGAAMAESREPTTSVQLAHWGLASPFNHHTVVLWPGSQLRQERPKINSIQLPANNCHLAVSFFIIPVTHQEPEHMLSGSWSFERH